ncbi:MAG: hypothetical protein V3T49_01625, partial [Dehalococcoidia bacterium]
MTTADQQLSTYPARLNIDYVGTNRNRLTAFFRTITAIPIWLVMVALGASMNAPLVMPVVLMILFRQKYPRWWYDF